MTKIQEFFYPSIGRCIYCGATGVPLTDEHIIPLALQGIDVFSNASCPTCQETIGRFEAQVIKTFEHFRGRYGLRRRKPGKRKKSYKFDARDPRGLKTLVTIPAAEMPAVAFLYNFKVANILENLPPFDPAKAVTVIPMSSQEDLTKAIEAYGWDGNTRKNIVAEQYARMLAKIGHAFAITLLGPDAFQPLCPDIILGRAKNWSYLVGGSYKPAQHFTASRKEKPETTSDHFHSVGLIENDPKVPRLLVARIRLFQQIPYTPMYHVAVGRFQTDDQFFAAKQKLADHGSACQTAHTI